MQVSSIERLVRWAFVNVPGIHRLWFHGSRGVRPEPPFVPFEVPLERAVIGLVTTGGVYHSDQPSFRTREASPDGDGTFRELDLERERSSLRIRHDWYDHTDAETDLNLVLPYERLGELASEGVIRAVHPRAISLMGHVERAEEARLERRSAPRIARWWTEQEVDAVLLVPA